MNSRSSSIAVSFMFPAGHPPSRWTGAAADRRNIARSKRLTSAQERNADAGGLNVKSGASATCVASG